MSTKDVVTTLPLDISNKLFLVISYFGAIESRYMPPIPIDIKKRTSSPLFDVTMTFPNTVRVTKALFFK